MPFAGKKYTIVTSPVYFKFPGDLRDRPAGGDPVAVPEQPALPAGRRAGSLQGILHRVLRLLRHHGLLHSLPRLRSGINRIQ